MTANIKFSMFFILTLINISFLQQMLVMIMHGGPVTEHLHKLESLLRVGLLLAVCRIVCFSPVGATNLISKHVNNSLDIKPKKQNKTKITNV